MISNKTLFGVLVVLCLSSTGVLSVAVGQVYKPYDSYYFSVEYPPRWDVKRSMNHEYSGWDYAFIDNIRVQYFIKLTIGADQIRLALNDLDIKTQSFGKPIHHFLDTLNFKNLSSIELNVTNATSNITYLSYENMYFSVEHPSSWLAYEVPHAIWLKESTYHFSDNRSDVAVSIVSVDPFGDAVQVSVELAVPSNSVGTGKFEEPILHFLDTLTFKM